MSYTREEILRKVAKIRVLTERGVGGEAEQARRTLENIMEKYQLDASALEERELVCVPHEWDMRYVVKHLAWALDFEVFTGGKWKDKLFIKVTPSEWDIYNEILKKAKKVYQYKKNELKKQLQGYMTGFLDQSYPISKKAPMCPECVKEIIFDWQEKRYVCSCGYKGKKVKIRHVDASDYSAGRKESGFFLT
jgi:ribosomal protein S27AE